MNSLTAAFAFSMTIGDNEVYVGVFDEEYVNQMACIKFGWEELDEKRERGLYIEKS